MEAVEGTFPEGVRWLLSQNRSLPLCSLKRRNAGVIGDWASPWAWDFPSQVAPMSPGRITHRQEPK